MIGQQNFQNGGNPYNYINPIVPYSQPQQQTYQNNMQPTIQYSSIVLVRSEEEARNYPVGLGTSVPFKNESQPYMYTKTMGFNQLEQPVFKRYRLVEEIEDTPEPIKEANPEVLELQKQIDELRELIKSSMNKPSNKRIKEDVAND